ncbi:MULTISPECIES: HlyD family secretion protein [Tatumella]|uniref:HlyD family secretion protein n=1 Tax=Tatumella punctata TaxID=399969 RepID=A0ABW1VRX4_9GAMM|nr:MULTISPECIES: efflux RND transporter periplasmic adaptor subunit [unclassified Tatumella]MBS0856632.1 HlyD family efflux transporter periplasmic adaptor subunit [Tatumella sp. JGM16]MBS0893866.1 HlyD family efflux transporter periplasmic adaptor subunit [Tatumella sp. JGM130]MBS0913444.1 HlyD family efflux transporter periplasmic adaptor subunit [Tatumella sp. JGM91]
MNKRVRPLFITIVVFNLIGCRVPETLNFSGYSYGDFIYLSYFSTEKIEKLCVKKGQRVSEGQPLVKMETYTAENTLRIAEQNYLAEEALLTDLTSGARPAELNVVRAQLERAVSARNRAQSQLRRYQKLYASQMISAEEWQKANDDYRQKQASVRESEYQLEARQLPARQAQITNQQLRVESAKLKRDKARWDIGQSTLTAPQSGVVYDTLYLPGERATAGRPVISLLPAGNIKIRFYIPEKQLGQIHTGMKVSLRCDGCSGAFSGRLRYISPRAEYTPPVIYSTSRRETLLYMAEAVPEGGDNGGQIKVGQPFQVEILPDE